MTPDDYATRSDAPEAIQRAIETIDDLPVDSTDHEILDIERGKILASLQSSSTSPSMAWDDRGTGSSIAPVNVSNFKWAFTLVILTLGVAASATVLTIGIKGAQEDSNQTFLHQASQLVSVLELSWTRYETLALWIHEACNYDSFANLTILEDENASSKLSSAAGFCSRDKFKHLYEHISTLDHKVIAISYMPNITDTLRGALEEESRIAMKKHKPDFNYSGIRDYLSYPNATFKGIEPSPKRPFYFPIHYLEPMERNENALDLDMYSFRRAEIDKAMATMKPVMGPRGKLLQEDRPDVYAVELIHPGISTSLPADLSAASAVSKVVIRIPNLIERAATATSNTETSVYIYDETNIRTATNDGKPVFLAATDVVYNETNGVHTKLKREVAIDEISYGEHSFTTTIQAADHTWRVIILGKETKNDVFFVTIGGAIILIGCIGVALGFHVNFKRLDKIQQIKTSSETEKAELAMLQAKREMHLNDFIAHEVRNPLSSAIAALSFVKTTAQERVHEVEARQALLNDVQIIDSSLDYINDLLRNMLDIHRTASKKLKLQEGPTDILKDIFDPVKAILFVKQSKAKILVECPENLLVKLDRLRVKQIILNLAINSSKFVEEGFIRLRAQVTDEGYVRLLVEDSGPGIRPEQKEQIFSKFQASFDLLSQGTGMGLHICKLLSDLMLADLYLDESYNSGCGPNRPGARFVVELNRRVDQSHCSDEGLQVLEKTALTMHEDSYAEHCQQILPEKLSVLFVDDDFVLRKLFKRTLQRAAPGWTVEEASNGETALSLLESNPSAFDIIFMDMYMASVEKQLLGTETVKVLRQQGVSCVVCGLSANDMQTQFLESGADAFLLKPFPCQIDELQKELSRVLQAGMYDRKHEAALSA